IFEPHIERGAKNSLVLASSIIPIFDKIKQDKANGLSLPAIKNMLSSEVIVSKQTEKDLDKKVLNTAYSYSGNEDDWIGVTAATKLSKRSEKTIRRLLLRLRKDNNPLVVKKDGNKWLIKKIFILDHFNIDSKNTDPAIVQPTGQDNGSITQVNSQDSDQVITLLEKQIKDFKVQLEQKNNQLEKQAADFKEQLNKRDDQLSKKDDQFENLLSQKDQQIHQLHVLLKESKTSTIDYKPDENLGVFSKVLVKFGL
ncbi:MAG: hypothetical protein GY730_02915, partial [bacterium]|nr:hypothetical protein [bacterium]